ILGIRDVGAQETQSGRDAPIENGPLPTVDQIIDRYVEALGGRDAIAKVSTRFVKGVRITPLGVDESFENYSKHPDKTYAIRKGAIGTVISGSIGQDAWNKINDEPGRPVLDSNPTKSNVPQRNLQNAIYMKDLYSGMKIKG